MSRLPNYIIVIALLLAGVWSAWLGYLHLEGRASFLDRTEMLTHDLRTSLTPTPLPPENVVIVAIDDATVLPAGGYPITRNILAQIVTAIKNAGARGVAIDLLFLDATNDADDLQLAKAMQSLPTVIAGAASFDKTMQYDGRIPRAQKLLLPRPEFRAAVSIGLANISTDTGGIPRHVPMVFSTPSGPFPSFSMQAAGLGMVPSPSLGTDVLNIAGGTQALDLGWHLALRFYGPDGTIPTVSANDLLQGRVISDQFNDKIVVLGATAIGVGDQYSTPYDAVFLGVEVQATAIANLLGKQGFVRNNTVRKWDVATMFALALAGVILIAFLPLVQGVVSFLALVFFWFATVTFLFDLGYWMAVALPLAGSIPMVFLLGLVRQIHDRKQAQFQETAHAELGRFHAPNIAARIANDPDFLSTPEQQDAAIIFVDLSGFTGASESLGNVGTRQMLKEFHTLVVDQSTRFDGTVLDFMGDGAMIGFGIAKPTPKDCENALRAGMSLIKATNNWIAKAPFGQALAGVRVGAHFGPIVLSRLGHDTQQQIAATGDCVNVASRLMDVGKENGAALTVSVLLLEKAGDSKNTLPAHSMEKTVEIRGRREAITVALWADKAEAFSEPNQ